MKRSIYLLITSLILASCGGDKEGGNKAEQLVKLKKEKTEIEVKIQKLESEAGKNQPQKATPVSVSPVQSAPFSAFIEVQSQITGDENTTATAQAPGVVTKVLVRVGQRVSKGQTLAMLDAAAMEQQIKSMDAQLSLQKTLYEKQQRLWAQNIGTEVQLLSAKTQYDATQRQRSALIAQRDMYRIKSPISGTVDAVNVKEGDMASPGMNGIRVISMDKLKAEANLGENYLGKVPQNAPVTLIFPDINDSIQTKLSYVSQAVDPISRSFTVEVRLGSNKKLTPNMSCRMKIANYQSGNALVVPIAVIQKTTDGDMLYIADGNKAKAVVVTSGRISNGDVEILSGLSAGDKVITEGFEELENGSPIAIK